MYRKIYLIICALIFISTVSAQEKSREQKIEELRIISSQVEQTRTKLDELESRQDTIAEEVLSVNPQDKAEAERIGAEVERLFPAGLLKDLMPSYVEDSSDHSIYSFEQISEYYSAPEIEYKNNSLQFNNSEENFGFIANIGGTLIETIDEQNKEFIALAKYKLPEQFKNIGSEYSYNGVTFRNKVQVVVGNTYLVRVFNQRGSDEIFALKIHRKDSDSSLVLFVKLIKNFSKDFDAAQATRNALENAARKTEQALSEIPQPVADYAAQQAVMNALLQKGFYNLTVEATTTEVTVRGTVPKGKMAEMMMIAQETAKRKINNQVTENDY